MGAYEKQLEIVKNELHPGETIVASLEGVMTAKPTDTSGVIKGAMVATDQRFIYAGKWGWQSENRSYPWAQVTSIDYAKSGIFHHITVTVAGAQTRFLVSYGPAMQSFLEDARGALAATHAQATSQAPPPSKQVPDVMDQIAKLGQLHDAGVLTDDEFAAKKAELLKRV